MLSTHRTKISMLRINAERLLTVSPDEVAKRCKGRFILVFQDKEIETSAHPTIVSSYFWQFHRRYPRIPLLSTHHVDDLRLKRRFAARTPMTMMERLRWLVHDTYCNDPEYDSDALDQFMYYEVTGGVYNASVRLTGRDVNSIDMLDLIEIADYEPVRLAREANHGDEASISALYRATADALMNDPMMAHNRLSKTARSGLVNMAQVQQVVAARGYGADLSKGRFPISVKSSYLDGITSYYEQGVESRQAGISLGNSKTPLEKSEYQNRRFQLAGMYVQHLYPGDCGSQQFTYFTILGETYNEHGDLIAKSDLENLDGKYFLDDDDVLKVIKPSDKHLIGRTVRMRSPGHCAHRSTAGVCEVCFGKLSDNVIKTDNIGQICTAYFGQRISQELLSTKHLLVSIVLLALSLTQDQMKFLELTPDRLEMLFRDVYADKDVQIIIDGGFATNLADLYLVDTVEQLIETDLTSLPWMGVVIDGEFERVQLQQENRTPSFTHAMLDHIRRMNVKLDEHNRYVIPMQGYDWSKPILMVPKRTYDTSDFAEQIRSIVESKKDDIKKKGSEARTYDNVLNTLYRHVVTRMSINIVNLEILLYAFTIRDRDNHDYSLSKTYTRSEFGVKSEIFYNRSASAVLVFERQRDVLNDPKNYVNHNVMDHPFDALFLPEVLFPKEA